MTPSSLLRYVSFPTANDVQSSVTTKGLDKILLKLMFDGLASKFCALTVAVTAVLKSTRITSSL